MGATILVVDDHADNRALAGATLEGEGHRVLLASNGEEAIELFARKHPECVLLDVRMPMVDGLTACKRIRGMSGGALVSIMFVTALHDLDTFDRALEAGGDDFLTKPFRPQELVVRVLRRFWPHGIWQRARRPEDAGGGTGNAVPGSGGARGHRARLASEIGEADRDIHAANRGMPAPCIDTAIERGRRSTAVLGVGCGTASASALMSGKRRNVGTMLDLVSQRRRLTAVPRPAVPLQRDVPILDGESGQLGVVSQRELLQHMFGAAVTPPLAYSWRGAAARAGLRRRSDVRPGTGGPGERARVPASAPAGAP